MTNPKDKFFLYAVASCSFDEVKLEFTDKLVNKKTLSFFVITLDVIVVLSTMFFIYFLENNI